MHDNVFFVIPVPRHRNLSAQQTRLSISKQLSLPDLTGQSAFKEIIGSSPIMIKRQVPIIMTKGKLDNDKEATPIMTVKYKSLHSLFYFHLNVARPIM